MRILVVGAGPAGLCAAAEAALGKASAVIAERGEKAGKKLYITGKGRCNVTNLVPPGEFLNHVAVNAKFLYGAINSFTPYDTVELFSSLGLETKTERGNRVFPVSDKASDVTKALIKRAESAGAAIRLNSFVSGVKRNQNGFSAVINGEEENFDKIILACGGKSYPSTGSDGSGYSLAQSLGHSIIAPVPALVRMILKDDVNALTGVSLKNVSVSVLNKERFGEMLFTSDGVSGPVILTLSSLVNRENLSGAILKIDLKPALSAAELDKRILFEFNENSNKNFASVLPKITVKALVPKLVKDSGIPSQKKANSITREERVKLISVLKGLSFELKGLADVTEAVVTSGGVKTGEVNPRTMESKLVPGLYFAGEMIDYDAFTGGFNIQAAISTGIAAGRSAVNGN